MATFEQKRDYYRKVRASNYEASCRLEGGSVLTYKITQVDDGVEGYYEATHQGRTVVAESLEELYYQILTINFGVQFTYELKEE